MYKIRDILKNLQQKDTEKRRKKKYTEKCTAKKYRRMYRKNILTNLQTKNSLDFSGLFLGPEKKTEKIREKFPGRKNPAKKILAFLQKKKNGEMY